MSIRHYFAPGSRLRTWGIPLAIVLVAAGAWGAWRAWTRHLLARGRSYMAEERWMAAAGELERYVAACPRDAEARLLLARALLGVGRHRAGQALEQLEQIPDTHPRAAEARVHGGEILKWGLKRAADAEREYRRALELDPNNYAARQGLFSIYWWEARRTPEAWAWLDEMYRLGSPRQRLKALIQRLWMHYAEFPPDSALPLMQEFVRADPQDFGARVGLARCLLRFKQYEQGVALLDGCLAERPDDASARSLLATYYLERGQWNDARRVLDEWPAATRELTYWELQGQYLEEASKEFAQAIECFQRVLSVRPDRWAVRHRLSRCLEATGRRDEAQQERQLSERVSHALLSTRVEYLLKEVVPRLESQPEYCRQIAELFQEVGLEQEANCWNQLVAELKDVQPDATPDGDIPAGQVKALSSR